MKDTEEKKIKEEKKKREIQEIHIKTPERFVQSLKSKAEKAPVLSCRQHNIDSVRNSCLIQTIHKANREHTLL